MRRSLLLVILASALFTAPVAEAQPEAGEGCGTAKRSLREPDLAFAAYARGPVRAFASPGGKALHTFGRLNQNGVATVFGVLAVRRDRGCDASWYEVQLPIPPNGAVGWVKADEVELDAVRTRIEVDISRHRVWFFRGGRLMAKATAGTGTQWTPTPTGSYYVNQRFRVLNTSGPFGPGAIGISAFSPVLTDWAQGGPIAIHGTNDPSSVGRSASNGCIRIHNHDLRRVLWATKTGSPVLVHA
jgi:lipoprotein-anchoring transpeptidase ErfK/SrfK